MAGHQLKQKKNAPEPREAPKMAYPLFWPGFSWRLTSQVCVFFQRPVSAARLPWLRLRVAPWLPAQNAHRSGSQSPPNRSIDRVPSAFFFRPGGAPVARRFFCHVARGFLWGVTRLKLERKENAERRSGIHFREFPEIGDFPYMPA